LPTFSDFKLACGVPANPGFNDPAYAVEDYSLPNGSSNAFFVVFDPT
jgi:hypothetical protein